MPVPETPISTHGHLKDILGSIHPHYKKHFVLRSGVVIYVSIKLLTQFSVAEFFLFLCCDLSDEYRNGLTDINMPILFWGGFIGGYMQFLAVNTFYLNLIQMRN